MISRRILRKERSHCRNGGRPKKWTKAVSKAEILKQLPANKNKKLQSRYRAGTGESLPGTHVAEGDTPKFLSF